ncbi:uncharacterized protein C8Q71DRAFT_848160 [Rhodofomes roseus]|uniref:Uncharacterized protein n=1 Tax=Rhodofomes roseus TaxID=34475 RepID=A0ABQ8KFX3_9APHY|nr:uncharacterized protein C8Q71DRAFT_848160 [Rhodofomes roseus]KAH9836571.1 hypothetical protein C8Q71DRAFT_848160 [Rhodofomes roseus]
MVSGLWQTQAAISRPSLFAEVVIMQPIRTCKLTGPDDTRSCEWLYDLQYALSIILIFVIAWFSALRVYAISHRSWWPAVITLTGAVVAIPVQLFADIRSSRAYVAFVGRIPICTKATLFSDDLNTRLIFAVRTCAIFSDLVVLCCTWYFAGVVSDARERKARFIKLILQQGTIYFISLLILNVVQIIVETSLGTQTVNAYYTATFTGPISSILTTRFMLELRTLDRRAVVSESSGFLSDSGAYSSGSTTTPVELSTLKFSDQRTCSTAV